MISTGCRESEISASGGVVARAVMSHLSGSIPKSVRERRGIEKRAWRNVRWSVGARGIEEKIMESRYPSTLRLRHVLYTPTSTLTRTRRQSYALFTFSPAYSVSASCILTQTPPFEYKVTSDLTQTFSTVLLPSPNAHAAGGLDSGFESMSSDIPLKA